MPYVSIDIESAQATGPGPYTAKPADEKEPHTSWWYVAGKDGRRNVLRFEGSGGAVFTTREIAEKLAAKWNARSAG